MCIQRLPGVLHEGVQVLLGGWQHHSVNGQAVCWQSPILRLPTSLLHPCKGPRAQCQRLTLLTARKPLKEAIPRDISKHCIKIYLLCCALP